MIHYQIAGRNNGTQEQYDKAEAMLRQAKRCNVVNSRLLPMTSFHNAAYASIKTLLDDADMLITTDGWETNKLAVLEVAVARAIGIPIEDISQHLSNQE